MARLSSNVSDGGRSQSSCCFCPITSMIFLRNASSRWRGTWPSTRDLALGGVEQPGEHLEGRGLARAVGAQEAHALAGRDLEGDAVHRLHGGVVPVEERAEGGLEAGRALVDLVVLPQSLHRHHGPGASRSPLLACYALDCSGEPRPRAHRRRSARRVSGRRSEGAGGAVRQWTPALPGGHRRVGRGHQRLLARSGGERFPRRGEAPGGHLARPHARPRVPDRRAEPGLHRLGLVPGADHGRDAAAEALQPPPGHGAAAGAARQGDPVRADPGERRAGLLRALASRPPTTRPGPRSPSSTGCPSCSRGRGAGGWG